tara:strand:+ start:620 stop:1786 length:1167 start_codon:yes stop_codon:yes gene_type:complete
MKYNLVSDSWDKNEIQAINKVISSGIYTYKGKFVAEYENKISKFFKVKYCVSVNSGSSANLISVASLFFKKINPLKRGDEVIVPTLSWSTTYHPLQQYGLNLKFVDIDINTLNVKAEDVIKACTNKTKLIVAVSILGNPVELDKLRNFCQKKKIYLMEDNCESMGAKIKNKYTGTYGIVNTFSTFFSHHISTIEGGFVLTDDKEIYEILLSLRSHGWTRDITNRKSILKKHQKQYEQYCFVLPGYNVRSTNLNCAIGISQLKKLPNFLKIRRKNHKLFHDEFKNDERFYIQKSYGNNSSFAFTLILKPKFKDKYSKLCNILKKNKIEYRLITGGSFFQHPVKKFFNYKIYKNSIKNVEYLHKYGLFVGNHPKNLSKEIKLLRSVLNKL